MRRAVIVDAVRTPMGKRNGQFKDIHPVDLATTPLRALTERNDLDPALIEDVIMGCVMQVGEQAWNVGRNAALAAGFPETVTGVTIDRQCGSSQQSAHFAAQGVIAGAYDVVVAAGVESMTRVPMGASSSNGPGMPLGPMMMQRYDFNLPPQGIGAQMIAEKWGITREQQDELALESHRRAARATDEGRFETQVIPMEVTMEDGSTETVTLDQGIRRETSLEKLASLQPAFDPSHTITAGNASQITDGSAALLIMGEDIAEKLGLEPMAAFHTFTLAGDDPRIMLSAPIPATAKALEKSGLSIDDIGLFEINEAFASVPIAWRMEMKGSDPMELWERTNVNGGAIALGHPLGASGARLMTTLVHEMVRTNTRYGLQSMCEGGGMANGTILELL